MQHLFGAQGRHYKKRDWKKYIFGGSTAAVVAAIALSAGLRLAPEPVAPAVPAQTQVTMPIGSESPRATVGAIITRTTEPIVTVVESETTEAVSEEPDYTEEVVESEPEAETEEELEEPKEDSLDDYVLEDEEESAYEEEAYEESEEPSYSGGYYALSSYERSYVEQMVMGEMGGESYLGQMAVAQAILDMANYKGCDPITAIQTSGYQAPLLSPSDSVRAAVSAVFDNGERATGSRILVFYNPTWCVSEWHESLTYVTTIDGVRFFDY